VDPRGKSFLRRYHAMTQGFDTVLWRAARNKISLSIAAGLVLGRLFLFYRQRRSRTLPKM
jgi:hypothetical protein